MSNNSHNQSSSTQNASNGINKDKQSHLPTSVHSVSMSTLSDSVRVQTKKSTTNSNRVQHHHQHHHYQPPTAAVNVKADAVGNGPYKQTPGGIDLNQQLKAANLNTIINNLSQQQNNINFATANNHNEQQQQQQQTNHSDKSTNNNNNHDNVFIKNNHLGKEFSSNSTTALLGNNFLSGAHQLLASKLPVVGKDNYYDSNTKLYLLQILCRQHYSLRNINAFHFLVECGAANDNKVVYHAIA